jgi:adenylosuccinate lyase
MSEKSVCPLDFRYGHPSMKTIFSDENKLKCLLQVEATLARAHAKLGTIPESAAKEISKKACDGSVKPARVAQIEAEIKHDIMAVVKALTEQCDPEAGKYVHLGATSNDIIDTATAIQIKEALAIIEKDVINVIHELAGLAQKHRNTIMVGRTHGQWAIPTTFGLKMAVYALEMVRHLERLREMRPRICVGKMLGAVGTGASFGKKALKLQDLVMEDLGLAAPIATTQILQRDRHAEMAFHLANIASSLEKFATEVRNLQRREIGEVQEYFDAKKQVGSSTMAQKRNPITSENICGLARVVRGLLITSIENIPTWHERDLTNSSAERFTIPHAFVLTDHLLRNTVDVFKGLHVDKARMLENLDKAKAEIMAEPIIMALVDNGMGRQDAHELVRQLSMRANKTGKTLGDLLKADKKVKKHLTVKDVEAAVDPRNYLGVAGEIVDAAVKVCKEIR